MDWLTEPHYVRWNCIKNHTQSKGYETVEKEVRHWMK